MKHTHDNIGKSRNICVSLKWFQFDIENLYREVNCENTNDDLDESVIVAAWQKKWNIYMKKGKAPPLTKEKKNILRNVYCHCFVYYFGLY